jgi:hypothetical protein
MSDMAGDAVKVTVERGGKLPRYNCSRNVFRLNPRGCFETGSQSCATTRHQRVAVYAAA